MGDVRMANDPGVTAVIKKVFVEVEKIEKQVEVDARTATHFNFVGNGKECEDHSSHLSDSSKPQDTLQKCQKSCMDNPACQGVTYYQSRLCSQFSSMCDNPAKSTGGALSYKLSSAATTTTAAATKPTATTAKKTTTTTAATTTTTAATKPTATTV